MMVALPDVCSKITYSAESRYRASPAFPPSLSKTSVV